MPWAPMYDAMRAECSVVRSRQCTCGLVILLFVFTFLSKSVCSYGGVISFRSHQFASLLLVSEISLIISPSLNNVHLTCIATYGVMFACEMIIVSPHNCASLKKAFFYAEYRAYCVTSFAFTVAIFRISSLDC